jgi:DUF2934 family protein
VPKKQKTPKKSVAAENRNAEETPSTPAKSEPGASTKPRKITAKTSSRKTTAPRAMKARKKAAGPAAFGEPTAEQIQLRAYFISEHRHRHGTPGDHRSDWLEARRQLMIEAQRN